MKNQPIMVAKANKIIDIAINMPPKFPSPLLNAEHITSEFPLLILTPLTRITSAVSVHIIIVSIKTSSIPQQPCVSGSFISHELCTATVEPSPASFEKAPRLKPVIHAFFIAKPTVPPTVYFKPKADFIIFSKAGIISSWNLIITINEPII